MLRAMFDRTDAGGTWRAQNAQRNCRRSVRVAFVAAEPRRGERVGVITSSQARTSRSTGRARARVATVVAVLVAVGAGCGGTAARQVTGLDASREPAHGAQRTQPSVAASGDTAKGSATARSVVPTQLDALMRRYDAATSALLARLSDAADPMAATTKAYLSVFAPGSSFALGALASWAREAAQGHTYRPGPRGQMLATKVTSVEPARSGTVGFGVCVASSFVLVDSAGQVLESQGGVGAGRGVAVLVDGQWLLRDLSLRASSECSARSGSS